MRQFALTPAAGKRLIGKAIANHAIVIEALKGGTVVIIAGTTNGYVAEEVLESIDQARDFRRNRFFRGVLLPPSRPIAESGRLPDDSEFPGEIFTEIDAISLLTGASAQLVAAGGVGGAEGSVWLAISGKTSQENGAVALLQSVASEPAFVL